MSGETLKSKSKQYIRVTQVTDRCLIITKSPKAEAQTTQWIPETKSLLKKVGIVFYQSGVTNVILESHQSTTIY